MYIFRSLHHVVPCSVGYQILQMFFHSMQVSSDSNPISQNKEFEKTLIEVKSDFHSMNTFHDVQSIWSTRIKTSQQLIRQFVPCCHFLPFYEFDKYYHIATIFAPEIPQYWQVYPIFIWSSIQGLITFGSATVFTVKKWLNFCAFINRDIKLRKQTKWLMVTGLGKNAQHMVCFFGIPQLFDFLFVF